MILGLLPMFKRSGSTAAIVSIIGGLVAFVVLKFASDISLAMEVGTPMLTSLVLYISIGLFNHGLVPEKVLFLLSSLNSPISENK
jgi:hypothetical protein